MIAFPAGRFPEAGQIVGRFEACSFPLRPHQEFHFGKKKKKNASGKVSTRQQPYLGLTLPGLSSSAFR